MIEIWTTFLITFLVAFKTADAAITGWTKPTIGAASGSGTLSLAEDQTVSTTIDTYVATSGASIGDYTLLTTGTPFAISTSGALTITSALDFETTAAYTIEIQVVDDSPASGTATISITVTDVNESPAFASTTYGTTIADASKAGTTVTTVPATDQDSGDVITYSIAGGDSGSHFKVGASSGVITVNTDVTLDASTTAGYALQIEAADDDESSLTGTTTVFVVLTSCSGAASLIAGCAIILLAAFITVLQ